MELASSTELAERAADFFLSAFASRDIAQSHFTVALSGGRISQQFFEILTLKFKNSSLALDALHFFWVDERCISPQDEESNYAMAKLKLIDPLGIAPGQVHRIKGELATHQAIDEAEAELCRVANLDSHGNPVLDLLILGMGEDGHVASLFPNESVETKTDRSIYQHVLAPKPPPNRITLGYDVLAIATTILGLISSSSKRESLKNALNPCSTLPMGRVLHSRSPHTETLLLTDFSI